MGEWVGGPCMRFTAFDGEQDQSICMRFVMTRQTYKPGERLAKQIAGMEARLIDRLRQMERRIIKWAIASALIALIPATGVSIAITMLMG